MKILQINSTLNWGSTGKIAEEIGNVIFKYNFESYVCYGRYAKKSNSQSIKIGNIFDFIFHVVLSRAFDNQGLNSIRSTKVFIREIEKIKPDIIHLHNIHGYYLNYKILFDYLNSINTPVIWTLHDCWAFTGHCSYFEYVNCNKWKKKCLHCPQIHSYPKSIFIDRSKENFKIKKELFPKNKKIILVPVSDWLANILNESFFSNNRIYTIKNGIDIELYKPQLNNDIIQYYNLHNKFVILGVANKWEHRKGLDQFEILSQMLNNDEIIVLIGLTKKQMKKLPCNIIGIERTDGVSELVDLYSISNVLFNPTLEDNYPTVNLESISCGTPVITYNTGGSGESIIGEVGYIVEKNDLKSVRKHLDIIKSNGKKYYVSNCRETATKYFDKKQNFEEYYKLYDSLIGKKDV